MCVVVEKIRLAGYVLRVCLWFGVQALPLSPAADRLNHGSVKYLIKKTADVSKGKVVWWTFWGAVHRGSRGNSRSSVRARAYLSSRPSC